jgi:uncharacterized membrane protein
MNAIDAVGFGALALSMTARLMVARKSWRGWALQLVAGIVWLAFAIMNRSAPLLATSCLYLAIDAYGLWKWRR